MEKNMSDFTKAVDRIVKKNLNHGGVGVVGATDAADSDIFGFGNELSALESLKAKIHQPKVAPSASYWETDIEIIESCGDAPDDIDVFIYPIVKAKINALMGHFTRMEWLAYFTGEMIEGNWHIQDLVIPEQKVTPVAVFDIQDPGVAKIGVVHSHHDMGNKFSHTDDEYINQNNDISLCVSHGGIQGHVRVKTSCGKYVLIKANVIEYVEDFELNGFTDTFKDLIKIVPFTSIKVGGNTISGMDDIEFIELTDLIDDYQDKLIEDDRNDIFDLEEYQHLINIIDCLSSLDDPDEEERYDRYVTIFFDNTDDISVQATDLIDEIDQDSKSITEKELVRLNILSAYLVNLIDEYFNTDIITP